MKTLICIACSTAAALLGTSSVTAQGYGGYGGETEEGKPPPCRSDCAVGYGDGVNLAIRNAGQKIREYGCSNGRRGSPKQFKRWITKTTDGRVRVQINYECTGDDR